MMPGILLLALLLLVMPFLTGGLLVFCYPEEKRTVGKTYLAGLLVQFAAFDVICVWFLLRGNVYTSFTDTGWTYIVVSGILTAAGLILMLYKKPLHPFSLQTIRQTDAETKLYYVLFFVVLAWQLYMAFTRASFDGDDAYYVTESLLSAETGTMYNYLPYTGLTSKLDIRHALAVLPMWEAYLSRVSGIHATVIAHTVLPFFLIPLTYLVWYGIANVLFAAHKERIPVFMILIGLCQIFGNTSIYTAETFFLTRTWQGKALMADFVIPLILLIFCELFSAEQLKLSWYVLLVFVNFLAGMCTSIGSVLAAGEILLLTLFLAIYKKKIAVLPAGVLCCIPNLCYILIYMRLR